MYLITTNFVPAPIVTGATPIQHAGIVAITLMHHITMEQERRRWSAWRIATDRRREAEMQEAAAALAGRETAQA